MPVYFYLSMMWHRFKKERVRLSDKIIQRKNGTGKRIGCLYNLLLI